jgi:type IV pilus assembly protein PilO
MAMNFSLSRFPWYGQIGAFAGLALLGTGVFWYFYVQPTEATLATRRAELQSLRGEIQRGLATARRLPEFRAEVAALQTQLDSLRVVLPEERDVSDLLRRVQAMATQSNLTIQGFSPQAITTRELHAEWPIGLQLAGTYHDLGTFLERVSKFPRIINVTGLKIQSIEGNPPPGEPTITAETTATTFVLIEPQRQAEAAAGRGRGARGRGARGAAGRAGGRG